MKIPLLLANHLEKQKIFKMNGYSFCFQGRKTTSDTKGLPKRKIPNPKEKWGFQEIR